MKKIFIIIPFLFLISCSKNFKQNKEVLSEEQFIEITTDIQRSHALVNYKSDSLQSARNIRIESYNEEILNKHKVTKEKYNKTIEYYSTDADKLNKILEQVVKNLNEDAS